MGGLSAAMDRDLVLGAVRFLRRALQARRAVAADDDEKTRTLPPLAGLCSVCAAQEAATRQDQHEQLDVIVSLAEENVATGGPPGIRLCARHQRDCEIASAHLRSMNRFLLSVAKGYRTRSSEPPPSSRSFTESRRSASARRDT